MKLKNLAVYAVILILTFSCKKNDTDTTARIYLPSSSTLTTASGTETVTFKYDDQNHLTDLTSDLNGGYTRKYKYDSSDMLIQVDYNVIKTGFTQSQIYDYSTAGIINVNLTTKQTPQDLPVISKNIFNLNSKNLVVKVSLVGSVSGSYTEYEYDDRNNLTTVSNYNSLVPASGLVTRTSYAYDQQKNPFVNMKGNMLTTFLTSASVNNILTQTNTDFIHPNSSINYVNSTYEFNSDGYPVKQTSLASTSTNLNTVSTGVYTYSYMVK